MWCNAGNMGLWGWAMMIFLWGGIAALVVWAVRSGGTSRNRQEPTAGEILERRLASGNIDREQYGELRHLLGSGR